MLSLALCYQDPYPLLSSHTRRPFANVRLTFWDTKLCLALVHDKLIVSLRLLSTAKRASTTPHENMPTPASLIAMIIF